MKDWNNLSKNYVQLLISQTIVLSLNINKNPLLIKSIISPFGASIYTTELSHLHREGVKTNAHGGRDVLEDHNLKIEVQKN